MNKVTDDIDLFLEDQSYSFYAYDKQYHAKKIRYGENKIAIFIDPETIERGCQEIIEEYCKTNYWLCSDAGSPSLYLNQKKGYFKNSFIPFFESLLRPMHLEGVKDTLLPSVAYYIRTNGVKEFQIKEATDKIRTIKGVYNEYLIACEMMYIKPQELLSIMRERGSNYKRFIEIRSDIKDPELLAECKDINLTKERLEFINKKIIEYYGIEIKNEFNLALASNPSTDILTLYSLVAEFPHIVFKNPIMFLDNLEDTTEIKSWCLAIFGE